MVSEWIAIYMDMYGNAEIDEDFVYNDDMNTFIETKRVIGNNPGGLFSAWYMVFFVKGNDEMGELTTLPNIAAKLEGQLADVGITTIEQLKEIGSREAWLRILAVDPSACIMRLSSLEGAIQGVRWHYLDEDTKTSLRSFYKKYKG